MRIFSKRQGGRWRGRARMQARTRRGEANGTSAAAIVAECTSASNHRVHAHQPIAKAPLECYGWPQMQRTARERARERDTAADVRRADDDNDATDAAACRCCCCVVGVVAREGEIDSDSVYVETRTQVARRRTRRRAGRKRATSTREAGTRACACCAGACGGW